MVYEHKGLSPVLTMAFIILGVIVGVVILWVFVSTQIDRSEGIVGPDCFTVDLEALSCTAYGSCNYQQGLSRYYADILVQRGVGQADLRGIRFAFEDSFGKKGVHDFDLMTLFPGATLQELQSLQFEDPFRVPVSGEPNLVRVVALIGEQKSVCSTPSKAISCSIAPGATVPPAGITPPPSCCQWPHNTTACQTTSGPLTGTKTVYCCDTIPPSLQQWATTQGCNNPSVAGCLSYI